MSGFGNFNFGTFGAGAPLDTGFSGGGSPVIGGSINVGMPPSAGSLSALPLNLDTGALSPSNFDLSNLGANLTDTTPGTSATPGLSPSGSPNWANILRGVGAAVSGAGAIIRAGQPGQARPGVMPQQGSPQAQGSPYSGAAMGQQNSLLALAVGAGIILFGVMAGKGR